MRILHCCLSNFYSDGFGYQENILPSINKRDGHDVMIIASTEAFNDEGTLSYTDASRYVNEDGIPVVRLPYSGGLLPHVFKRKLRAYEGLSEEIAAFKPDVIMFHGASAYALKTVADYKTLNPNVKLYIDNHADTNNSCLNWISRNFLHRVFYRSIIKYSYEAIDTIFYLTYETKLFLNNVYGLPSTKMEYLPLGGLVVDENTRIDTSNRVRQNLGISPSDLILLHSGKLSARKKTVMILEAFSNLRNDKIHLLIIGTAENDIRESIADYSSRDSRIKYLGWKSRSELKEFLCACDLYVQPGGQSATLQEAICSGSAVAVYPHLSYKHLLGDAAFYVEEVNDIHRLLEQISENASLLINKKKLLVNICKTTLDYSVIASRLYK